MPNPAPLNPTWLESALIPRGVQRLFCIPSTCPAKECLRRVGASLHLCISRETPRCRSRASVILQHVLHDLVCLRGSRPINHLVHPPGLVRQANMGLLRLPVEHLQGHL